MSFYPKISEDTVMSLELIKRSIDKDPKYLDAADCPYSEQLKQLLRTGGGTTATATPDLFAEGDEIDTIDQQIKRALSDLETMGNQLSDPSDRLNYLKTKTSLLEKLVSLREKVFNLKELQEFRSILLQGLDQVCTPDQITDFMKRLDGVLGVGTDE